MHARRPQHARLVPLVAIALAAACAPSSSSDSSADTTELASRTRASERCEREGRYLDSRCDTDCALRDPDCALHDTVDDPEGDSSSVCVAIRGNGPRIPAHFGSIARILEHYGLIAGAAGGSSGSITTFLLESVQSAPWVESCAGCAANERALRAAFLFKSIPALIASSELVDASATLASAYSALRARDVEAVLERDPARAAGVVVEALRDPALRALVNPELIQVLEGSARPAWHAQDVVQSVRGGLSFEVDDPAVFVRPGVVSFPAFVERIGPVGDFYAGYGPVDARAMEELLDLCAVPARGRTWEEIERLPAGGPTCGQRFASIASAWRSARARGDEGTRHRLDERIGDHLHAITTTAVVEGPSAAAIRAGIERYRAAQPFALELEWDDVSIGYWASARDLGWVLAGTSGYRDAASLRRRGLGVATWRQILVASPAEPGLSRAVELPDNRYSVGGWSDLTPVQVLRDVGCETVVLVTRPGGAGGFTDAMARLLGASDDEADAVFDLADPQSTYAVATREAEGRWCSDWDSPPVNDPRALVRAGYDAPFESTSAAFRGADAYGGSRDRVGLPGCTPGVAPDAPAARFVDIARHPARREIEALAADGIVAGFPDRSFRPEQPVTRAQLAAMIASAFLGSRAPSTTSSFRDVPRTHWAAGHIARVAAAGFMRGYPDGTFGPDRLVTRQEALVALASGLGLPAAPTSRLERRYIDASEIASWARDAIARADAAGLLERRALLGPAGALRPSRAATRAEIASFVFRARTTR